VWSESKSRHSSRITKEPLAVPVDVKQCAGD
jgi:hypothetical protein